MTIKVPVTIYSQCPCCEDDCHHQKTCTNHKSAGDFRSEDGLVPDLEQISPGLWICSQNPQRTFQGAVLIDGTHMNEKDDD